MSYRQSVLRDDPIAFWHLNGTSSLRTYATILLEYADYAHWLSTEPDYAANSVIFTMEDLSTNGNHGAFTIGSPNFIDILPLATLSSYDTQLSGCKINSSSEIVISNKAEFYKMFYSGTEHLSFGIEFWLSFDSNPSTSNSILHIGDGAPNIGRVYVDNDTVYFTIYDIDGVSYTAYRQVQSWDSQMHILASYDKGSISISVNGMFGDSVTVPSTFSFGTLPSDALNIQYTVGPSQPSSHYVINDLAFYNYALSTNLIKSHMVWAANDSSPQTYVKQTSGYFFDIKETDEMLAYKEDFSNVKNYKKGVINNLIVDSDGLTIETVPSLTSVGMTIVSNGLSVYPVSSAKFTNFSNYFSLNNFSIMGQIDWGLNVTSKPEVILAIEGLNVNEWIYLAQSTDNKLTLYYHQSSTTYPYTEIDTIIAQVATANSTPGTYNFGIAVKNQTVSLYLSSVGSATTNSFPAAPYSNLNLYLGNQYSSSATSCLGGAIRNISILSSYVLPSEYTLFGQKDNFTIPLSSDLTISQKGTWTYNVPSSQFTKIMGSRMTWDTGTSSDSVLSINKNVIVESSIDKGASWQLVTNGYPATKFSDGSLAVYPDTSFRVTISTSDSSSRSLPRLDNALIVFYKDLSILSDGGAFMLSPRVGSYIGDTYSIRKNSFNILSRSSNFGIKINQVNSSNSVATITPATTTNGYQAIEFWFRYDEISPSVSQFVLDTVGMDAYIYIDPNNGFCTQIGLSDVYVNGLSLGDGRRLTQGESYHFVCIYPAQTNAKIYLGGDQDLNYFSYATYGFISLYPNILTRANAQARYLGFLSALTSQINYTTDIGTSSNVIGSLLEYAGSTTDFNAGNPILSYVHPQITTI